MKAFLVLMSFLVFAGLRPHVESGEAKAGKMVKLPIVVKGNLAMIGVSASKVAKGQVAAAGKCWKWVDPCPKKSESKNAAEKKAKAAAWTVYPHDPESDKKPKGAPKYLWIAGPRGAKVSLDADKRDSLFARLSPPKKVTLGGKSKVLWKVELKKDGVSAMQIVPEVPPDQTGCWMQVDCDMP